MTVLILAAGKQQRWGSEYPIKQLLPIGNTTIIERIARQVMSYDPVVVTCNPELLHLFPASYCPKNHRWTCETLLNTKEIWSSQNYILLGDTVYSSQLLKKLFDCADRFRVFGNPWEIFCLTFQPSRALENRLQTTIAKAEQSKGIGTLRQFFRLYTGTTERNDISNPFFELIDHITDYTNDIDTPKQYENFLREWMYAVE